MDTSIKVTPQIIQLADVCFEMYSIDELKSGSFMLGELDYAIAELGECEVMAAIKLALQWKELEHSGQLCVH